MYIVRVNNLLVWAIQSDTQLTLKWSVDTSGSSETYNIKQDNSVSISDLMKFQYENDKEWISEQNSVTDEMKWNDMCWE